MFDFKIEMINDGSTNVLYCNDEQLSWSSNVEDLYDEIESIIEANDLEVNGYCITEN